MSTTYADKIAKLVVVPIFASMVGNATIARRVASLPANAGMADTARFAGTVEAPMYAFMETGASIARRAVGLAFVSI